MTTINPNWKDQARANIKECFDKENADRFIQLQKNMVNEEIKNQKDIRFDFLATASLSATLEQNQIMMLYFDRNIAYFENQLKNL